MKLFVTGATGYIGDRLVRLARSRTHEVVAASRRRPCAAIEWTPYDLDSTAQIQLPPDVNVIIHLAASTNSDPSHGDTELNAAELILKAAQRVGARFVFVSSQTARIDAPTSYGRTKWAIEGLVIGGGGTVIRPGMVYGGSERGLFGKLVGVVRALPVIPSFFPSPKVQPVHVDDLATAILNCAESKTLLPSVLSIGMCHPVSFTQFLRAISHGWVRQIPVLLPVPVIAIRLLGALIGPQRKERLGLNRLTSLFELPVMDTTQDLTLLKVVLRPMVSGMSRSGTDRRRTLIQEGNALMAYVLKAKPKPILVRQYARCIERLRGGRPLFLPRLFLEFPASVALLDDTQLRSTVYQDEVAWRLHAVVVLTEASVQGAFRFLAFEKRFGYFVSVGLMAKAISAELTYRLVGYLVRPFLRRLSSHPRFLQNDREL